MRSIPLGRSYDGTTKITLADIWDKKKIIHIMKRYNIKLHRTLVIANNMRINLKYNYAIIK